MTQSGSFQDEINVEVCQFNIETQLIDKATTRLVERIYEVVTQRKMERYAVCSGTTDERGDENVEALLQELDIMHDVITEEKERYKVSD